MPNEVVEMTGDVPRAAADVGDLAAPGTVHELGEQRQARAEVGAVTEQSTDLLGVSGRVDVVRRTRIGQPAVSHG